MRLAKPCCDQIRLNPGVALAIKPRRDALLEVTCCRLWLTKAGDPKDYFLQPGDKLRLGASEHWVVETLGHTPVGSLSIPARFEIEVLKSNPSLAARKSTSIATKLEAFIRHVFAPSELPQSDSIHMGLGRPSRSADHAALQLHLSLRA